MAKTITVYLDPKTLAPETDSHWRVNQTQWQPIRKKQASTRMQLTLISSRSVVLGPATSAYWTYGLFIVPGCLAILIGAPWLVFIAEYWAAFFSVIWGLMLSSVIIFMIGNAPWVFDGDKNRFYKGFDWPVFRYKTIHDLRITDMVAFQVLPLFKPLTDGIPRKKSQERFQLNLVMENGARFVILATEKYDRVMSTVDTLSECCQCPVWEGKFRSDHVS